MALPDKNAQGFTENTDVAKKGGAIAGDARKKLEQESGKSVVTKENYHNNHSYDNSYRNCVYCASNSRTRV